MSENLKIFDYIKKILYNKRNGYQCSTYYCNICKFINKSKMGYYDKVKAIDCLIKNVKFDCIGVKNNE